jgi:diguanylate cyclase
MNYNVKKRRAIYLIIGLIVGNYLLNSLFYNQPSLVDWESVIFQIVASVTSFYWLFSTYRHSDGRVRFFWLFLGMGCVSYIIGIIIWSFDEFVMNAVSQSILPRMLWIGQNGFYFCSLLMVIYKLKNKISTLRIFLDTFIVIAVAATFSWEFIIHPIIDKGSSSHFQIDLLYPILDLGVFFGVISFITTATTFFKRITTILLLSGFIVQIIADTIFTYLTLNDLYKVGSINEPLWNLAFLLIGLSGVYQQSPVTKVQTENIQRKKRNLLKHVLPYGSVIFILVFYMYRLQEKDSIFLGLIVCVLLVIIRQVLTLIENDKLFNELQVLNEKLESEVSKRTEELGDTLNQMEYLAYHDTVTGLPNRRLFESNFSNAIKNFNGDNDKIVLMLLDLDRFKYINDSLGHSYGDLLLKEVGEKLDDCLDSKSIVCRIGGDEFGILMEQCNVVKAEQVAKKIIQTLGKPYFIKSTELHVTPSIGIALYPDHGTNFETLFMEADTAMYNVKDKGKNNYQLFEFSMLNKSRIQIENSLRNAIKNEEFVLHYQPQVSLKTGEILGVEALIRWKKPEIGLIPPSDFIPIAEETGLISSINQWVLKTACMQVVEWGKKGFRPIKMAVNISSIQFQQSDFIDSIMAVITETKIKPEHLELEITERIAIEDIEGTVAKLSALKQLGIKISIDDFGTGYSSFQYLSQFQIDRLKIDRSFIQSIEASEKAAIIVKLITLMAKGLNLKVIAEGVEKRSQKKFLKDIQCDEYQGYLFSKPVTCKEIEKLIALPELSI